MKDKLRKILSSLDGIKEVKPRPYLYTRLKVKFEKSIEEDISYNKIERPVIILTSIFIIFLTLYTFNFDSIEEVKTNYTMEELYFEQEKNDLINLTSYEE
ncbi:MAG: hypothetical protein CMB81_04240 [Flammeovirgaceae bacterium]|jgi:hypothetical protein|nr:hypothetical protein [Flammeovirgaceae bacterium]|tara:strand:- start:854 stop:1153 length:300 start_codon:yes stop_codon:yes gene_type:complete